MTGDVARAVEYLRSSRRWVVFSGAGISAESGIPTFRGPGGLWTEISPLELGAPQGVVELARRDTRRLVALLQRVAEPMLGAKPSAAHRAVADLERAGRIAGVVTQNVDDLHERAGTQRIYKLHGDLFTWRPPAGQGRRRMERESLQELLRGLAAAHNVNDLIACLPRDEWGDWLRPDIVLFGEALPWAQVHGAERLLAGADAVLVVGTSGAVEPAAGIVRAVADRGVPIIEINLEPSAWTPLAAVSLFGPAGDLLPGVAAEIG